MSLRPSTLDLMNRFFQIFLISIVMILAFSGLLICVVIAFAEDDPPVLKLWIWGAFSAIIFATSLAAIIRFNRLWIREAIETVKSAFDQESTL